MSQNPC